MGSDLVYRDSMSVLQNDYQVLELSNNGTLPYYNKH